MTISQILARVIPVSQQTLPSVLWLRGSVPGPGDAQTDEDRGPLRVPGLVRGGRRERMNSIKTSRCTRKVIVRCIGRQ